MCSKQEAELFSADDLYFGMLSEFQFARFSIGRRQVSRNNGLKTFLLLQENEKKLCLQD